MKKILNLALITVLVASGSTFAQDPKGGQVEAKAEKKCVTDDGARKAKPEAGKGDDKPKSEGDGKGQQQ
jgi:hypothetical protein